MRIGCVGVEGIQVSAKTLWWTKGLDERGACFESLVLEGFGFTMSVVCDGELFGHDGIECNVLIWRI